MFKLQNIYIYIYIYIYSLVTCQNVTCQYFLTCECFPPPFHACRQRRRVGLFLVLMRHTFNLWFMNMHMGECLIGAFDAGLASDVFYYFWGQEFQIMGFQLRKFTGILVVRKAQWPNHWVVWPLLMAKKGGQNRPEIIATSIGLSRSNGLCFAESTGWYLDYLIIRVQMSRNWLSSPVVCLIESVRFCSFLPEKERRIY